MKPKPGYKTSEFWFTLVSFIFSGLYLAGIVSENEHKEELITVVTHAVESCILISGQLIILYKYINGRSKIKANFKEKETNDEPRSPSSETVTKPRSNKSRSRKPNTKRKK